MSKKQPFCDKSHAGTAFKPLKFTLDQETDSIHLCGCKLSRKAPFCDGKTCLHIAKRSLKTQAEFEALAEE